MAKPVLSEQEINTIKEKICKSWPTICHQFRHHFNVCSSPLKCLLKVLILLFCHFVSIWMININIYFWCYIKYISYKDYYFFASECFWSNFWKLTEQKINAIFIFYLQIARWVQKNTKMTDFQRKNKQFRTENDRHSYKMIDFRTKIVETRVPQQALALP